MSQIVYAIFLLVGASVAVSGQSEPSKQTVADNQPFTLTISYNELNPNLDNTADQIVQSGRWVDFRVRKTNISDHEIAKMSHVDGAYGYNFDVRDSNGKVVGPKHPNQVVLQGDGRGGHLNGTKDLMLQSGASKIDFLPLDRWFDIDKPGTYTIQASAHIIDDPKSPVVKSNIIKVTVLPENDSPPNGQ